MVSVLLFIGGNAFTDITANVPLTVHIIVIITTTIWSFI